MSKNINRGKSGEPFDTGPHKKPKHTDDHETKHHTNTGRGQTKNKTSST